MKSISSTTFSPIREVFCALCLNRTFCVHPQVVTNRDTLETLLCIAYVFEVSTSEHGAQHHIYRLVKDWQLDLTCSGPTKAPDRATTTVTGLLHRCANSSGAQEHHYCSGRCGFGIVEAETGCWKTEQNPITLWSLYQRSQNISQQELHENVVK